MRLLKIFCSVVEDYIRFSSGTRTFQEQPLDDDRQTGQGMASLCWSESTQLPVAILRLRLAPHHQRLGPQILCQVWRQNACFVAASDEGNSRLHSVERNSNRFKKRPEEETAWRSVVPDRSESDLRRREIQLLHPDQWNSKLFHDKRKTGRVFQRQRLCIKPLGISSEWRNQKFDCWK